MAHVPRPSRASLQPPPPGSGHRGRKASRMEGVSELRDYRLGREIGRGGFGVVFEALNVRSGDTVAMKRLSLGTVAAPELASIQQEIELLRRLNHPNIVRYIDSIRTKEFLYIVLEIVENGSLLAAIKRFGTFSEQLTAVYTSQVLRGLVYLHEQGVIHRDIKAANILTTKDGIVKLTDFGVAVSEADKGNSVVGSPFWMAPGMTRLSPPFTAVWRGAGAHPTVQATCNAFYLHLRASRPCRGD
ncbi:hypothetical protein EON68_01545 [archaeon]|nr:MAG: hypothetical protein EON68_01545 [archaeon]